MVAEPGVTGEEAGNGMQAGALIFPANNTRSSSSGSLAVDGISCPACASCMTSRSCISAVL